LENIQVVSAFEFTPYYEDFKGTITKVGESRFLFKGIYEKLGPDKIRVTELPIGFWTEDFKELLEDLEDEKEIKDTKEKEVKDKKKTTPYIKEYDDKSKDTNVDFIITFNKGQLEELEASSGDYGCNGLEKLLKLCSTSSMTNMNLFNSDDKLKKYNTVNEIIDDFFIVRLGYYGSRKAYLIDVLEKELVILSNKARYIQEVLNGSVDLRKKKKDAIITMLEDKGYSKILSDNNVLDEEYKYLVRMPMDSVSEENIDKLNGEFKKKSDELEKIRATTCQQMWSSELDALEQEYTSYRQERDEATNGEIKINVNTKKHKVVVKGTTNVVKKIVKK
jgi:DNA topoisomerase-2